MKVKHSSPKKLRAVKVGIPPTLEEQEEIATALSAMKKNRRRDDKKTKLQDLFRNLLHELMTARIRVHVFNYLVRHHYEKLKSILNTATESKGFKRSSILNRMDASFYGAEWSHENVAR
ncbi:MAG: hypothetical protein U5K38_06695 [Woeseiaceae bacterium]|nr:hypothetical protein [Woeseiaceae bacterium]